MLSGMWEGYWEEWLLAHNVIFDGEAKRIYINPNSSTINIKDDVYSAWKEWTLIRDNSRFLQAIRTIGGDPTGAGIYAGDIYFLINGWRVVLEHSVNFVGVLYSDDFPSAFETVPGAHLSTTVASNLVLRTAAEEIPTGSGGLTPEQDALLRSLHTLLAPIYKLHGLEIGTPVTYTSSSIAVSGSSYQTITQYSGSVTVERVS